jgi:hypothetical protein
MLLLLLFTSLLAIGNVHSAALAGPQDCTLTSSKGSSTLFCGAYGVLNQKKVHTLQSPAAASATNVTACAASCQSQPGCVSFGFAGPNSCLLFSESLKSMGLVVTSTGSTLYYSARCWKNLCKALPKTPACVCTSTLTCKSASSLFDTPSNRSRATTTISHGRQTVFSTLLTAATLIPLTSDLPVVATVTYGELIRSPSQAYADDELKALSHRTWRTPPRPSLRLSSVLQSLRLRMSLSPPASFTRGLLPQMRVALVTKQS